MLPNLVTLFHDSTNRMPTIHLIDSIKIDLYAREHLPPHFHAIYAEYEILIEIKTLNTYAGYLPNQQLKSVLKWAKEEKIKDTLLEIFTQLNPSLRK